MGEGQREGRSRGAIEGVGTAANGTARAPCEGQRLRGSSQFLPWGKSVPIWPNIPNFKKPDVKPLDCKQ